MNVVFEVIGKDTEIKFLAGAEKQGIKGIKGHWYPFFSFYLSSHPEFINSYQICRRHPCFSLQRHHRRTNRQNCSIYSSISGRMSTSTSISLGESMIFLDDSSFQKRQRRRRKRQNHQSSVRFAVR